MQKGKKEKAEKKSFEVAEAVESKVLLVKEDYLVVDIAGAIGFVASKSWNVRLLEVHQVYRPGQTVAATVTALPEAATGGRLLLSPKVSQSPTLFSCGLAFSRGPYKTIQIRCYFGGHVPALTLSAP